MKKGFWLYISITAACCILLILSCYVGWFFFYLNRGFSESSEQWGQFGDFFGGILNPFLSFITICILIKSSLYQEKQNSLMEKRERNKRFDDRFYAMITQLKFSFESLTFNFGETLNWNGEQLLKHMEHELFDSDDASELESTRFKETIFPVLRQFYLLLKMIRSEFDRGDISEVELKEYHTWLINCTDYNVLRFVVFSVFFYETVSASKYISNDASFIIEIKNLGFSTYISKVQEYKIKKSPPPIPS
ncbi:Uncharacterised protein [Serratia marcescens]|uniref:hypothetical protein n=1 Tax=Serratia TaxID=613 RepID=UPI000744E9A7|nr:MULTISPECIES: hypothetical protein [Serratia]CUY35007.1 Uncharacterised protein [Serratia marcescens]CUY82119.1 Uncharacterised protein [Serratia marcescens]CUY82633.1 Uncharacterised protein [Serratia marcescens]CUY99585.1 Uncharacterised protein [Serratia marcescens]CUZ04675.1 Uncharacterised protein [Serratia marcescens]